MNGGCDTLRDAAEIVRELKMPSTADWSLHAQLQKDTIDIGDLPLCRVLVITVSPGLMRNAGGWA